MALSWGELLLSAPSWDSSGAIASHAAGEWAGAWLVGGVLLGLVGLAVQDDDDPIGQLTRKVRRATAGEDVDFDVNRDDEIGELADAIGEMVDERRSQRDDLNTVERYRRELYEITADPDLDDGEKIERLLELGCDRLGVENGLLTNIDEPSGRYEVERVVGSDFVTQGTVTGLVETFCRKTVSADDVLAIYNAPEEGYGEDPGYARWNIGCYIGAKILVDEELYGTLCFVNERPRAEPFTADEKVFVDLMSRWVSHALERRRHVERLQLANRGMEAAPIGITITDPNRPDNPLVRINPTFEEITGYSATEAKGRNCRFLQGPGTDPDPVERMRTAIDERESVSVEIENYRKDGTPFWNHVSLAPVRNGDGEVKYFIGFQEDVTERKEREREFERYREFMDAVLDAIDDVFYVLDENGKFLRWNESFQALTGYADDEIRGMHALEFFREEDWGAVSRGIEDVFESGVGRVEAYVLTKEGDAVPYEFVAVELEDPEGERVLTGIGRDITQRKQYERELERTANLLQQASRMAGVGGWVVTVGPDGARDITWTEGAYRVFELSPEADLDIETALDFFHPQDRQRVRERIDRAAEGEEISPAEARIRTAAGNDRWLQAMAEPVVEDGEVTAVYGAVQDVTAQKRREMELERTKDLLQQAGRLARIGGWELDVTTDPPTMTWTDELYEIHGIPPGTEVDFETAIDHYHPDDRDYIEGRVEHAVRTGVGYDMEVRALTSDGGVRWVRALGEAVTEDGEVVKLRGAIQDVTEQKEREFALQTLHESTRGLLNADAPADASRIVVEAAESALDVDAVGVFLYDEEDNRLEPTSLSEGFGDDLGEVSAVGPRDESLLWHAFVTDSLTVIDDAAGEGEAPSRATDEEADDGRRPDDHRPLESFVDHGLVIPIGTHGVLLAAAGEDAVDADTRRLVETLVASAEAALDRLASEANLRDRDAELEARNERLRRQIRINDTIRSVDRTLIGATSQADLEAAVCEKLAEGEEIAFVWIGGFDSAGETLVPRAWAGDASGYLDSGAFGRGGNAPEPAVATAEHDEPTVVENVARNVQREPWRRAALAANFQSVLAVPLSLEEYSYGVLAVYATEPRTFGDLERSVFAELGESIANAITTVSTKQALHADTLVSLTLRLEGTNDPLCAIATAAGCEVTFEGLATHADDEALLFVRTRGADVAAVTDALEDRHAVSDYRLVSESEEGDVFEVELRSGGVVTRLVRHGGHPRAITADSAGLDVEVDVPVGTDVRAFTEIFEDDFAVELLGRREVSRSLQTRHGVIETIVDDLTKRQREVLRTAYLAGFFNWPRDTTGEELAEMLDVSQPTVNRHLRHAERAIMRHLFEDEAPAD